MSPQRRRPAHKSHARLGQHQGWHGLTLEKVAWDSFTRHLQNRDEACTAEFLGVTLNDLICH
jgi:hypothetical protein